MIAKSLILRSRRTLQAATVLGDYTFASGKGINFDTYGIKITDTYIQFGDDATALGPKLIWKDATTIAVTESDGVTDGDFWINLLTSSGGMVTAGNAVAAVTVSQSADGRYSTFKARDSGVGPVEIARMQGAADPYFATGNNGNAAIFYYSGVSEFTGNVSFTAGKTLTGYNNVAENHTAGDTLTLAESGSIHTNYGAGGAVALKLPASATAGTTFKFVVGAAQELRITVSAAAEVFLVNGGTSTDDGGNDLYLVADDEGEMATFTCIAAGVWLVDVVGTWTPTQP